MLHNSRNKSPQDRKDKTKLTEYLETLGAKERPLLLVEDSILQQMSVGRRIQSILTEVKEQTVFCMMRTWQLLVWSDKLNIACSLGNNNLVIVSTWCRPVKLKLAMAALSYNKILHAPGVIVVEWQLLSRVKFYLLSIHIRQQQLQERTNERIIFTRIQYNDILWSGLCIFYGARAHCKNTS